MLDLALIMCHHVITDTINLIDLHLSSIEY